MNNRTKTRATTLGLLVAGILTITMAVLAFTWPSWVQSYARDKAVHLLEGKFDQVALGEFSLHKNLIIVRDLELKREGLSLTFPKVTVSYTPEWVQGRATIHRVQVSGGSLRGSPDALRSSSKPSTDEQRSGRLDLSETSVAVQVFHVSLQDGPYSFAGELSLTGKLQDDLNFQLHHLNVSKDEVQVFTKKTSGIVNVKDPWPLSLTFRGGQVGFGDLSLKHLQGTVVLEDPEVQKIKLHLQGEGDVGDWSFHAGLHRGRKEASGSLVLSGISPAHLPIDLPLDPDFGKVWGDFKFELHKEQLKTYGQGSVQGLHAYHPKLARDPVVLDGAADVELDVDLTSREVRIHRLLLKPSSAIEVQVKGRVLYAADPEQRQYEVQAYMSPQPCDDLLKAMPVGLLPGLKGFELKGLAGLDLKLKVQMQDADATELSGGLDLRGCRVVKRPQQVESLHGPFMHMTQMKNGEMAQVALIPGHPYFTSWESMPPALPAAVVASEDGSFWDHQGFRPKSLFNSLRRNIELGTFQRGGSTITMQMVKNVLLSHERTVSRKLQELFLTWVVERELTKSKIMELYLNVVEFGPGIYGVGHAADYYFNKQVQELTSLEAAFLATLLPRPLQRHEMFCNGGLTLKHMRYVHRIHLRMYASHRISQRQFEEGEQAGIVFARPQSQTRCLERTRALRAGDRPQVAFSGLTPAL